MKIPKLKCYKNLYSTVTQQFENGIDYGAGVDLYILKNHFDWFLRLVEFGDNYNDYYVTGILDIRGIWLRFKIYGNGIIILENVFNINILKETIRRIIKILKRKYIHISLKETYLENRFFDTSLNYKIVNTDELYYNEEIKDIVYPNEEVSIGFTFRTIKFCFFKEEKGEDTGVIKLSTGNLEYRNVCLIWEELLKIIDI